MLTGAIREIFHTNLGVKKDERILVFTDRPVRKEWPDEETLKRWLTLKDIAMLTVETGRTFAKEISYYCFPSRGGHGVEPAEKVWKLAFGEETVDILNEKGLLRSIIRKKASPEKIEMAERIIQRRKKHAVDVVIALSNYSTSHTRFRDFLTRLCGTRYASMPLFEVSMFEGAMDVDWKLLEKMTRRVARLVNKAVEVNVTAPNGTDIRMSRKGRSLLVDTGNLRSAGSFGNLPAGEAFFAPVEGTAEGRLVLEWAPTRRLSAPVTLSVRNGCVTEVSGDDPFTEVLRSKLAGKGENSNIAELGIGTNEKASRPDNILESEKILGTVHIALGDNSSFGGKIKTPFHLDFVFFQPTVTLIMKDSSEELLMERGRMTASIKR